MPLTRVALILALPLLLSACGGGTPPAPPPVAEDETPVPTAPASPAKTADIKPLFGNWSASLADCSKPGAVITVSAKRFVSAAASCDISGFSDNKDGSFTAALNCGGEKQSAKMIPVFAPTGEGINLTYPAKGGTEVTVLRCAAE